MREKRKKNQRKLLQLLIIGLIIYLLLATVFKLLGNNIRNIYIDGNIYLTDQQVIDTAKLTNYPNIYQNNWLVIKSRLLKSPYIENVNVSYSWYNKVNIKIVERKRLFLYKHDNQLYLEDGTVIANDHNTVPLVVNYVPKNILKNMIKKMSLLSNQTIARISDITYQPNDVDKERFLLNMIDGNVVYINIIRFENLNKYDSIKEQIDNKTGILNLDYGTNFEVKKW